LAALATASLAVGLGTAVCRSTIPRALDGVVTAKAAEADGPLPSETAYFIAVDQHRLQVDRAVHDAVAVGDRIHKRRWSATLTTPRGGVPLRLSRDVRGLAPVAGLLLATAALLLRSTQLRKRASARG
jgi:hypothetical protein